MKKISGSRGRYLAILASTALVAPALAAGAAYAQAPAAASDAQPPAPASAIGEVVVTATRRSENIQHVAVSIQALGTQVLEQHQVVSVDDFSKLLPSFSFQTLGPGRSDIYFRGISTGSNAGLPTAGLYLDDIPIQTSGRSLDVHMYDMARLEALSGPQGTLFGSSSLSGTLRLITNKPDASHFSAGYNIQADKYGPGDPGGLVEGYVNQPLGDRAALRVMAFYDHQGGYINNTPQSLTFNFANQFPGQSITENNANMVKKNFNPEDTFGGRAALKVDLNENWTATGTVVAQSLQTQGSFLYDPHAGDLNVHDFSPTNNRDNWQQFALTISGHVGLFDITYSGGYLNRNISTDNDYTGYTIYYDHLPGYTHFPTKSGGLLDPIQDYSFKGLYTKQTHEGRISLQPGTRFHLTSGVFYQLQDNRTTSNYYVPGLGATGAPVALYGDDQFYIRNHQTLRDYAVYTEAGYDILENVTITGGVRGFVADNNSVGFSGVVGGAKKAHCPVPFTDAVAQACTNINQHIYEQGETHKFNISWQIDPTHMVYATYSTGFRPGGANTLAGIKPYNADTLINYEAGFKTTWFGRLRWNGAIYYEDWDGMQYRLVVPGNNGIGATYNAGAARVYGAETDVQYRIGAWLLSGTAAYNDSRLSRDLCNLGADHNPLAACVAGPTTAAPAGTQLPNQPPFKISATARYEFPIGPWDSFAQMTVNDQTKATSYISTFENGLLGNTPGFATVDFSVGGKLGNKSLEFFMNNAFDERGQLARNTFCSIDICSAGARIYPTKPQFFGVKFGQQF